MVEIPQDDVGLADWISAVRTRRECLASARISTTRKYYSSVAGAASITVASTGGGGDDVRLGCMLLCRRNELKKKKKRRKTNSSSSSQITRPNDGEWCVIPCILYTHGRIYIHKYACIRIKDTCIRLLYCAWRSGPRRRWPGKRIRVAERSPGNEKESYGPAKPRW